MQGLRVSTGRENRHKLLNTLGLSGNGVKSKSSKQLYA